MYQYLTSYVLENVPRASWVEKNLFQEKIYDIREKYVETVLKLITEFHDEPFFVNTKDIPNDLGFGIGDLTLEGFLEKLNNTTLPEIDFTLPETGNHVEWLDGHSNGFNIDVGDRRVHYTATDSNSGTTDLNVYKEGVDSAKLYENCVFTVNGLIHRSNLNGDIINLIGGGYTSKKMNMNMLGILNFESMGGIKQIPITEDGISGDSRGSLLSKKLYIRVGDGRQDLKDKSILLSVAGFLLVPDGDTLKRVGEDIYELDFTNQPWVKRLFKLKDSVCNACINKVLSTHSRNKMITSLEEFYSDDGIKSILTLTNSFFIVVNTPTLRSEVIYPEFGELPGRYVYKEKPTLPLITGLGLVSEYHYRKEHDRYSIATVDSILNDYQFEYKDWRDSKLVDNSRVTKRPYHFSKGYFLKLYN